MFKNAFPKTVPFMR